MKREGLTLQLKCNICSSSTASPSRVGKIQPRLRLNPLPTNVRTDVDITYPSLKKHDAYKADSRKTGEKPPLCDPPNLDKSIFFTICWWNGGGNIKLRLSTNPELRKFVLRKPDIFVYGESCTSSSLGLSINGYTSYLHKAKLSVDGNFRRGLAIFYLKKYRFLLTKVYSSNIYDIVWIRLSEPVKPLFFCFFYSPGSHHPLHVRTKFYDVFSSQFN